MFRSRILWGIGLALALLLTFGTGTASADTFTSDLNAPNSAILPFQGPYGTVTVNLTSSTTANITFTSDTANGNIYLFGGENAVDLNVNATSFTVSSVNGTNAGTGFTPGPYTNTGSGNVSGFGDLNLTIKSFDGFTHSADTVTFTVTNTSSTWASASDVLVANSQGFDAAAHVFVTSSPANAHNGAIQTGFVGEGPQSHVTPEPSSLAIAGLGALGFVGFGLRRRLKK